MLGSGRLRHYAKLLRSYTQRHVFVLLYHRVANLQADPFKLSVTPENFSQQMEVLRRFWNPISLDDLIHGLKSRKLPRRAVLVTFDDGYADNLHNARPILERYEIPAVVFVIAGSVGAQREFWWDELEKILLQPGTLPEEFNFRVNGIEKRWTLGKSAVLYSEEDYRAHIRWYFGKEPPTERHGLYVDLYHLIKPLSPHLQDETLETLRVWSRCRAVASNLPMTTAELQTLRRDNLVEVGAHTVSHPILSSLAFESQRLEIIQSRRLLQEIVDRPITGFAYPYGGDGDYTRETVGIVRKAGFEAAFSTASAPIHNESDVFRLPRKWVRDWNGEQFASCVQRWTRDD